MLKNCFLHVVLSAQYTIKWYNRVKGFPCSRLFTVSHNRNGKIFWQ